MTIENCTHPLFETTCEAYQMCVILKSLYHQAVTDPMHFEEYVQAEIAEIEENGCGRAEQVIEAAQSLLDPD